MIVDGEDDLIWRIVEKYEHPLVKFSDVRAKAANEFLKERATLTQERLFQRGQTIFQVACQPAMAEALPLHEGAS